MSDSMRPIRTVPVPAPPAWRWHAELVRWSGGWHWLAYRVGGAEDLRGGAGPYASPEAARAACGDYCARLARDFGDAACVVGWRDERPAGGPDTGGK